MASTTYQGLYPLIYTFGSGASYLNLYPTPWHWGGYRGASLGVPNSGSLYGVALTNDQIQALGNAIRLHLATGSVNQTISGVQVASSGTTSINVVVAAVSFTINLGNADAANLAMACLQYVSTGSYAAPHTDGSPIGNW
jgi:hypothetical protein